MSGNTRQLPIIPLRSTIIFPGCVETIQISLPRNLLLLRDLRENQQQIVMMPVRDGRGEIAATSDLENVGVLARPIVTQPSRDNTCSVTFEGVRRVRLDRLVATEPYLSGDFTELPAETDTASLERALEKVFAYTVRVLTTDSHYSPEVYEIFKANRTDIDRFVDVVSHHLHFPFSEKRSLLTAASLKERIFHLLDLLSEECQRIELEDELKVKVEDSINKSQREFFLRAKLKEIKRELGEDYDDDNVSSTYRRRINMMQDLPVDVREQLFLETERLKMLSPASAEFGSIKRYLDWLMAIPWNKTSTDETNLSQVEKIIDSNFYGAKDIKDRITEYLATRQLTHNVSAPVICLTGPAGTGKASLAAAVATALQRKLVRFSVAGFSSTAELRGEPHTLEGAMPGKIIRALIETNCVDPVFLIEDLDKLCFDEARVSIALAFLEIIDPRQNRKYIDDYLALPIDLSRVIFIFSVRGTEMMPEPLLERMEVIEFAGYVDREKVTIAERYLIPSLLEANGISKHELNFTSGAIKNLIRNYTMEAGLSQVKQRIESICRKYSKAKATTEKKVKWVISEDNLEQYFGTPVYIPEMAESHPEIGVAAGVAWTGSGGDIMMIEGLKMRGSGNVACTGSLGEVMRESVQAAHSFVRSKADMLRIPHDDFSNYDIHVHFPQGAIPKDGPSAGVTISLVIASVLSDRPIRNDIAMTGEVSLRGKVLPVSGIREKVAAAHRAGIYKMVLPSQNRKDIKDITKELRDQMEFIYIDRTDQLFEIALLDYDPAAATLQDLVMLEMRRRAKENKPTKRNSPRKVARGSEKPRKSARKKKPAKNKAR
ncbi:MAG: endopeptidase La [Candidatus Zixiibacteriota bacterium]